MKLRPRSDDDVKKGSRKHCVSKVFGKRSRKQRMQAAREASGERNVLCGDEEERADS